MYLNHSLFLVLVISTFQILNGNPSKPRTVYNKLKHKERQFLGLGVANIGGSFANVNNGGNLAGNIFRAQTVTRTLVRTVATITVAAFRTCTTSAAGLTACAGRRRRGSGDENSFEEFIEVEPSMVVILGTSTISNQTQISSILKLDQHEGQSVQQSDILGQSSFISLYPSTEASITTEEDLSATTYTPWSNSKFSNDENVEEFDNARINLAGTTTSTVTISVTAVASTFATGASNTLTVSYLGCNPGTLPVSGTACV